MHSCTLLIFACVLQQHTTDPAKFPFGDLADTGKSKQLCQLLQNTSYVRFAVLAQGHFTEYFTPLLSADCQ